MKEYKTKHQHILEVDDVNNEIGYPKSMLIEPCMIYNANANHIKEADERYDNFNLDNNTGNSHKMISQQGYP